MSPSLSSKSVFISYRHRDSSPIARWLAEAIERDFGKASVFVDTSALQSGDEWPKRIQKALKGSSVLIAVIGPEWLKAQDEHYQRRIDGPNDWVRNEILCALQNNITIIPLLVLNGTLPEEEALPIALQPLLRHRAFELRESQWQNDIQQLMKRLEQLGFCRWSPTVKYPQPRKAAYALTTSELKNVLRRLSEWRLSDNRIGPDNQKKIELTRTYEFVSFEDAIHFMAMASRHIAKVDHHPDWENVWKSITVWLTTWDIGHNPSIYDVELAGYLDQLYRNYQPQEQVNTKKSKPRIRVKSPSPR